MKLISRFRTRLNSELHRIFSPGLKTALNANAAELPEWIQLAPYGEWPTSERNDDGTPEAVQVFTREDAAALVKRFNAWHRRLARLARINSCKAYVGHPDFAPDIWPERVHLADVTELQEDEHGVNGRMRWNADVIAAVRKNRYPSIAWDTEVTEPGRERPVMVWSVGMTSRPNIKGVRSAINAQPDATPESDPETKPEDTMLNNIIKALREAGIVKEGDSEDTVLAQVGSMIQSLAYQRESKAREAEMASKLRTQINAAADVPFDQLVTGIIAAHDELRTASAERDTRLNAAAATAAELNERINALAVERDAERRGRINAIIERLVETGRINKADADAQGEDSLSSRLNADIDKTLAEMLDKPVRLNTGSLRLGGHKPAIVAASERATRLNAWVDDYMVRTNCTDRDKAWEASKADKEMAPLHAAMRQADADRAKAE